MKMTLAEIAFFLGGTVIGADDTIINNIRSIEEANEGDLTFICLINGPDIVDNCVIRANDSTAKKQGYFRQRHFH